MNVVELQQLKEKAMQTTKGGYFSFPSDTPIDQIAAIISFLNSGMIEISFNYSDALILSILEHTIYPNQICLMPGLSERQIQLITQHVHLQHYLWIHPSTPVSKIQVFCKYLKPYTAMVNTISEFPLSSSLVLLSSLRAGTFFNIGANYTAGQIRTVLSFINHGVMIGLPAGISADLLEVINQVAAYETCFFFGTDFKEEHLESVNLIGSGLYCMFHPNIANHLGMQMVSSISQEAGIRIHPHHASHEFLPLLPYLFPRVVVYLESHWQESDLQLIFSMLPDWVGLRIHSQMKMEAAALAIKTSSNKNIIYFPYDMKKIMAEHLIAQLHEYSVVCMGPQFEYACDTYVDLLCQMNKGWFMPDPRMTERSVSVMARFLPTNCKVIFHPCTSIAYGLLFVSSLQKPIQLNLFPETPINLLKCLMGNIKVPIMLASEIDKEVAQITLSLLNKHKQAVYIPNPDMDLELSKSILMTLSSFCYVRMPNELPMSQQLQLIMSLPKYSILVLDDAYHRDSITQILTVLPETIGLSLPRRLPLVSATQIARQISPQNILYIPSDIESLVGDLLVLTLPENRIICLGSHKESEDALMVDLMTRNKKIWVMLDSTMPYARARYLASLIPDNFKLMFHPMTDSIFAQMMGTDIKQTNLLLNIHPEAAKNLIQYFLMSYKGTVVLDESIEINHMQAVLACGNEQLFMQHPFNFSDDNVNRLIDALPPTGILSFQVQEPQKAKSIRHLVERFHADQVLALADNVPIPLLEMVVSGLPRLACFYLGGSCRADKLITVIKTLTSGAVVLIGADIKETAAMAIVEKMGSRKDLYLMFHPKMAYDLLKKLLASLHPQTKVLLHPASNESYLEHFREAWNTQCILVLHHMLAMESIHHFCRHLDRPIQLMMHPLSTLSQVSNINCLANPYIFHCLSEDLDINLVKELALVQAQEVCVSASVDCPEKTISTFMSSLENLATLVCYQHIPPLQAGLFSQYLPQHAGLYLDSQLSRESLHQLLMHCRQRRQLIFNPFDKQAYDNIASVWHMLNDGVIIMFAPNVATQYINTLISSIQADCFVVFHPHTTNYVMNACLKELPPKVKVILHPESDTKHAISMAINLPKGRAIYFYPGTSDAQLKAIHGGVGNYIRFIPFTTTAKLESSLLHAQQSLEHVNLKEEDEKSLRP